MHLKQIKQLLSKKPGHKLSIPPILFAVLAMSIFVAGLGISLVIVESFFSKPSIGQGQMANSIAKTGPAVIARPENLQLGNILADKEITVYFDLSCPYCAEQYFMLKDYLFSNPEYKLTFKHFPKTEVYPDSFMAAEAVECAGEQGKLWKTVDFIFRNQNSISRNFLFSLDEELGLDKNSYYACLNDGKYADRVAVEHSEGLHAGVTNIPTTFINGNKFVGLMTLSVFNDVVTESFAQ